MNINRFTYYYFIGIGGIGMSALARYFKAMGKNVSGYDKRETALTQNLINENIYINFEDDVALIPSEFNIENTVVIYTPAVQKTNKILNHFVDHNFKVIKRSETLGFITQETQCLAIAGTHGKTTTSSLLGHILKIANLPSTAFLGGIVENYQSNIILGGDKISVVEADEFDRSFLKLKPDYACITSMDADHLDIYGNKNELERSFLEFASSVKHKVFAKSGLEVPNALTYDVERIADYYADNIQIIKDFYSFDFHHPKGIISSIPIHLPGRHNVENAVAAIAMALEIGVTDDQIIEALDTFKGIKRRFSRFKTASGKVIIDDYAHHPTEIRAIVRAVKNLYPEKKVLAVFQPHLYSRTRDFADEFAQELAVLENLVLIDLYPAREEPIENISSEFLADKIYAINGFKPDVLSISQSLDKIPLYDAEVILLMGAGNIDTLYEPLKTIIR